MMASPGPSSTPTARDSCEQRIQALLERLRDHPDPDDIGELYDATSAVVHGWAVAFVASRFAAEEVTVAVYVYLWHCARRYPVHRGQPWPWLQLAFWSAVREGELPAAPVSAARA
ncbi:hypothetical protein SAMN04489747_2156 [Auraticoccus monumenti]|uniref:Sigma-70 region 2 n=1 Tax=Auraticoccus monumenti TaxID=675864 RepID=A0A1G6Z344_9ACTN|nr:hypothetical protein SAMN04489747_2156 [Auraticoccus monumenti]